LPGLEPNASPWWVADVGSSSVFDWMTPVFVPPVGWFLPSITFHPSLDY